MAETLAEELFHNSNFEIVLKPTEEKLPIRTISQLQEFIKKEFEFWITESDQITHSQQVRLENALELSKQLENSGDGHRNGAVKKRSQVLNPKNDKWTKRDSDTGRFMDQKADNKPFKGVRKEK